MHDSVVEQMLDGSTESLNCDYIKVLEEEREYLTGSNGLERRDSNYFLRRRPTLCELSVAPSKSPGLFRDQRHEESHYFHLPISPLKLSRPYELLKDENPRRCKCSVNLLHYVLESDEMMKTVAGEYSVVSVFRKLGDV